jgi:S-layer homology domain.
MRFNHQTHLQTAHCRRLLPLLTVFALIFGILLGTLPVTAAQDTSTTPSTTAPVSNPDADGKFTIAIIPDSQQEVVIPKAITDGVFKNRTQWLVDNKDALDLRFVIHTGDVENWDTPDHAQYKIGSEAMNVLVDANIPSQLCLGNHDTAAVGPGGSAADPSRTRILVRDTSTFNTYYPVENHPGMVTFEPGKVDNAYQTFTAGGKNWLVLTFELWPRAVVIDWAKEVVESHPDYNVLIATHSYLNGGSDIFQKSDYGETSPQYLYDNLVKVYSNIKMVFCGHAGVASSRIDTGVNGNKIVTILGCFHSNTTNPVQLLEINAKENTISTRFYAPFNGQEWPEYAKTVDNMDFIVPPTVKPDLIALIDSSTSYNEDSYSAESWEQFQQALIASVDVCDNAFAAEKQNVDALNALNDAIKKLSPKVAFNDVAAGSWYFNAVSYVATKSITGGTGGGNFSPNATLKRGDCLVLLMKSYHIAADEKPTNNFSDAGNTYYTGYLSAAKRLGITNGIGNNLFAPEKEITREELFTFLYNALKKIEKLPDGNSGKNFSDFTDAAQINTWAKDAMWLFITTGVIKGNNGELLPASTTTRAEMAQVLYNLLTK